MAQRLNVLPQIPVVVSTEIGQPTQSIHGRWHQPLQNRDHVLSDFVPEIDRFVITRVLPKQHSFTGEIGQDLVSSRLVQWPDDDAISTCRHTGETGQSCSSKHPQKNRLRLIVGRMPDCDSIRPTLLCDLLHSTIPQVTGRRLQRQPAHTPAHIEPHCQEGNIQSPAHRFDERLVGIGFLPAQSIIEMHRRQGEAPGQAESMQERQQRDRIGPSRHSNKHMLSTIKQATRSNSLHHPVKQGRPGFSTTLLNYCWRRSRHRSLITS
jgi:hypothetical protein